jgi:predicted amidophosphoribosyltransferase
MSQSEIIRCDRCGQDFEANVTDYGTYWHEKCYKPQVRIQDIDTALLRGMMLKIYFDAKARLDRYKKEQETTRTHSQIEP